MLGKYKKKDSCINTLKVNKILSFCYDFHNPDKETYVNSSAMNFALLITSD